MSLDSTAIEGLRDFAALVRFTQDAQSLDYFVIGQVSNARQMVVGYSSNMIRILADKQRDE
jgi:hypothetical protein